MWLFTELCLFLELFTWLHYCRLPVKMYCSRNVLLLGFFLVFWTVLHYFVLPQYRIAVPPPLYSIYIFELYDAQRVIREIGQRLSLRDSRVHNVHLHGNYLCLNCTENSTVGSYLNLISFCCVHSCVAINNKC